MAANKYYLLCASISAVFFISFSPMAQDVPIEGIGSSLCKNLQEDHFTSTHIVGQWVLGYYSGALAENASLSKNNNVYESAEKWNEEYLLESAKAFCVNHPNARLHKVADLVVSMVLKKAG